MLGGHGGTRLLSRFRHPDLMEIAFGLGLFGFRELVQNIRRLLHPALLGVGAFENFGQGFPEFQCPSPTANLGSIDNPHFFQNEQQPHPGLFAFPVAVLNGQNLRTGCTRQGVAFELLKPDEFESLKSGFSERGIW